MPIMGVLCSSSVVLWSIRVIGTGRPVTGSFLWAARLSAGCVIRRRERHARKLGVLTSSICAHLFTGSRAVETGARGQKLTDFAKVWLELLK